MEGGGAAHFVVDAAASSLFSFLNPILQLWQTPHLLCKLIELKLNGCTTCNKKNYVTLKFLLLLHFQRCLVRTTPLSTLAITISGNEISIRLKTSLPF